MSQVVLDSLTAAKFREVPDRTEVLDDKGALVGFFEPAPRPSADDYEWAKSLFTEEELLRSEHRGGGRTTAELLAYLEGL